MSEHTAEAIQLEAREEAIKFALAAMDDALEHLNTKSRSGLEDRIERAVLAIREAKEQLEGKATP